MPDTKKAPAKPPAPEANITPADQLETPSATAPVATTFTVLHPMDRNGEILAPGDDVRFSDSEPEHVRDLLEQGIIAVKDEAKEALAAADAARKATLEAPSTAPEPDVAR